MMDSRRNMSQASSDFEQEGDDYCLVHMPVFDIQFPPLGLGLLQAILQSAGLQGRVHHASLQLIEEITPDLGQMIYLGRDALFVDWMFAHIAFPELKDVGKMDEYIAELRSKVYAYQFLDDELIRIRLLAARQWAEGFIEKTLVSILARRPRVVGCNVFHTQYIPVLALLRRLRQTAPEVVSMIGGPHCGGVMGQATHCNAPWVDYVVAGDADELIVSLVRSIMDQGRDIAPAQAARGVLVPGHRETGYPPADQWFAITADLSQLPVPNHQDYMQTVLELAKVREYVRDPVLTFESSRGCYWAQKKPCSFCSVDQGTRIYRKKDPGQVLQELEYLALRHGSNCFLATDSIMDMSWFRTFLPALAAQGAPYRLFYEVPASLTREQVKTAAEAGVVWFQPGIESFDTRVLQLMNKSTASWQNVQMLKWCRQYGVRVTWNILYGFPGEQDQWYEEMAELLPLVVHLQPPTAVGPVNFCRNSVYYDQADQYQLQLQPDSAWRHVIPWSEAIIADVLYTFVLAKPVAEQRQGPGLTAVQQAVRNWQRRFVSPEPPLLTMQLEQDALIVTDSRDGLVVTHRLLGLGKELLLLAEDAPRRDAAVNRLIEGGYDRQAITEVSRELIGMRLLLEIDERFLTLAILGDCRPLPANERQLFTELKL